MVSGKISDKNGKPIQFAMIRIKGTTKGTTSDSTGNFAIKIDSFHSTIVISAVSFLTKEFDCSIFDPTEFILEKMDESQLVITMGLGIVTRSKKKLSFPSIEQTEKPQKLFTIFPNPVSNSSKMSIKWNKKITSDQIIEIYDPAGNLLQQEVIKTGKDIDQYSIDAAQFLTGSYILKIIDYKTHTSQSQQFVVQ